ncbi:MAG: hypothetical protein QXD62_01860 [Candidatus Woesearchaeota archaeon]
MKKSQVWVSVVLWILIGLLVLGILLSFGFPLFRRTREQIAFQQVVSEFQNLKTSIDTVIKEGPGSQRLVELNIPSGAINFSENALLWSGRFEEKLVEPYTRIEQGGVVIASEADVFSYENETHIIMENSYIQVRIRKDLDPVNVSQIVESITLKINNKTFSPKYRFYLLNDPTTETGTGEIKLLESGNFLVSSTVKVSMNTQKLDYDLYITLYSKADYIRFRVENVKVK